MDKSLTDIINSLQDLSIEEKAYISVLCDKFKIRTPRSMMNIIKNSTVVELLSIGFLPGVVDQFERVLIPGISTGKLHEMIN